MPPLYHAIYRRGVETVSGEREAVAILPWETEAEQRVILAAVAYALKTTSDKLEIMNCPGWPFEVMNPHMTYDPQDAGTFGWPLEGFKDGMRPVDNMVLGAEGRVRSKADRMKPVIRHVTEGKVVELDPFNVTVAVSSRPDFRMDEDVAIVPVTRTCQCGQDDCPVCVECRRVVADAMKSCSPSERGREQA